MPNTDIMERYTADGRARLIIVLADEVTVKTTEQLIGILEESAKALRTEFAGEMAVTAKKWHRC